MRNGYIVIAQAGPNDDWFGFFKDLAKAQESVRDQPADFKAHCALIEVRNGRPLKRPDGPIWVIENGQWAQKTQADFWVGKGS